jgi:hypothetical protein
MSYQGYTVYRRTGRSGDFNWWPQGTYDARGLAHAVEMALDERPASEPELVVSKCEGMGGGLALFNVIPQVGYRIERPNE